MSLIISETYPNNSEPNSTNYPQGSAKNISRAGDGTGFPFEKAWVNDWLGFQQAVLLAAGVTPSGDADTALNSQLLDALITLVTTSPNTDLADLALIVNDPVTGVAALSTSIQDVEATTQTLAAQTTTNADNITQEITDRTNALLLEVSNRQAAVQAAINSATAGDNVLQGNIDSVSQTVTSQTLDITAQGDRLTTAETGVNTLTGDLTALTNDFTSLQTDVNNSTQGLSATYTAAVLLQNRLNDVNGDGSGKTLEQLAVEVDGFAAGTGFATTTELNAVDVKADTNTGAIAAQGTQITGLQAGVTSAQNDADAAGIAAGNAQSSATASINRLNNVNSSGNTLEQLEGQLSSTAQSLSTLSSQINTPSTGLAATVSTQADAITDLETENATQASQLTTISATATQASTDATTANNTANNLNATVTQNSTAITNLEDGAIAHIGLNAAAGDSSAAINITAANGVPSRIDLKADLVHVVDPNDVNNNIKLFDSGGIIVDNFVRQRYVGFNNTTGQTYTAIGDNSGTGWLALPIAELDQTLTQGLYALECNLKVTKEDSSDALLDVGIGGNLTVLGGTASFISNQSTGTPLTIAVEGAPIGTNYTLSGGPDNLGWYHNVSLKVLVSVSIASTTARIVFNASNQSGDSGYYILPEKFIRVERVD